MAGIRYFVLLGANNRPTNHVFTGSSPRRAALKAATRGFTNIRLRERGTDRVHIYKGSRKKVAAPEDRPEWLPAKVWRPVVRKIRIEHLKAKKAVKKTKAKAKKAKKKKRR